MHAHMPILGYTVLNIYVSVVLPTLVEACKYSHCHQYAVSVSVQLLLTLLAALNGFGAKYSQYFQAR